MEQIINNNINISAPGKIILFGEHSVVYGKTALAFSLDLQTKLKISPCNNCFKIVLPALNISCQWNLSDIVDLWNKINGKTQNIDNPSQLNDLHLSEVKAFLLPSGYDEKQNNSLLAIFHQYLSILSIPVPMCLTVTSSLPVGGGLGSSAAFSVCVSAAFLYLTKKSIESTVVLNDLQKLISDWSIVSEMLFHGKPSGIDTAISTYGGAISIMKGDIKQLDLPSLKVLLINTGVSRKTKNLVDKVKYQYTLFQNVLDPIFLAMDEIVKTALSILNVIKHPVITESKLQKSHLELSTLVKINQGLLVSIGVSHPCIDEIIKITTSHGFSAKITGAGGGGFVFTIINKSNEEFVNNCQEELKSKGFDSWITEVKGKGVSVEV